MTAEAPSRTRGRTRSIDPPDRLIDRVELESLVEALIEEARQRALRRRRRRGVIAVVVVLIGLTLVSLVSRSAPTTLEAQDAPSASATPFASRPRGTIALTGLAQGPAHVYLWSPRGVRDSGIRGRAFGWSPDGSRLLVQRGSALYVARIGGGEVLLARHANAFNAAWSPDGTRIAFEAGPVRRAPAWRRILVVDADGHNVHAVSGWAFDGGFFSGNVTWYPDARAVVFAGSTATQARRGTWLYRVRADGTGAPHPLRIDASLSAPAQPTWSPDGSMLAFTATRGERGGLYVMNADGSDVRRVGEGTGAVWSPDGSMLAFRSHHGAPGRVGTWVARVDGTHLTRLPSGGWAGLSWSPDSRYIAFAGGGGHSTDGDVFAVHPDGSGVLRLTRDAKARYGLPLWRGGTATTEAG